MFSLLCGKVGYLEQSEMQDCDVYTNRKKGRKNDKKKESKKERKKERKRERDIAAC